MSSPILKPSKRTRSLQTSLQSTVNDKENLCSGFVDVNIQNGGVIRKRGTALSPVFCESSRSSLSCGSQVENENPNYCNKRGRPRMYSNSSNTSLTSSATCVGLGRPLKYSNVFPITPEIPERFAEHCFSPDLLPTSTNKSTAINQRITNPLSNVSNTTETSGAKCHVSGRPLKYKNLLPITPDVPERISKRFQGESTLEHYIGRPVRYPNKGIESITNTSLVNGVSCAASIVPRDLNMDFHHHRTHVAQVDDHGDYENYDSCVFRPEDCNDSDDEFLNQDIFLNDTYYDDHEQNENVDHDVSEMSYMFTPDKIHLKDMPTSPWYHSLGSPTKVCKYCHSVMWNEERVNKQDVKAEPLFSICCCKGQVKLPVVQPMPQFLSDLYSDPVRGPLFMQNIRLYNSMLSMTSNGAKIDHSINKSRGPYVYRVLGLHYHQFGSLKPECNKSPKYCQLYIYDTQNEVSNRINAIGQSTESLVDRDVLQGLLDMLDQVNPLVREFRKARDCYEEDNIIDLKILMKISRSENGRENNITESDEVACLIVGNTEYTCGKRDVVIEDKNGTLRHISDLHPLMMPLQYPILFPRGEDGFHENIPYFSSNKIAKKKREKVSAKEFYSYKFQIRPDEGMALRQGGRLYQQYVVDAFSSVEQSRISWLYRNQDKLRSDLYHNLQDIISKNDIVDPSTVGKGFILPSTYVGSPRYMQQYFMDSLAICRDIGYPSIFLTMTCNTAWDEVQQMLKHCPSKQPQDNPDVLARVFKLKLDQLYDDIKNKHFFSKCIAVMYVVEYQKRGLPHAHVLVWLDAQSMNYLHGNIDKFVSAEIPNWQRDPYGYACVKQFMMHGPCGAGYEKSPCMKGGKCSKSFPKKYCATTMKDDSGFPIYKRRKTGHTVKCRGAVLDNQWVVPFNRNLLVRYQCHMNIEVCNHGRCIKYLFKYCLKGPDRATVLLKSTNAGAESTSNVRKPKNEIKMYLDGRYVCGPEAAHRMFGYDIHHRSLSVERLSFHLPNQKYVTFRDNDILKDVCDQAEHKMSKLEAFFDLCKNDCDAKKYTYQDIPQHYVWHSDICMWTKRKRGRQVGRMYNSHHGAGEMWYMRMLLTKVRGPESYTDLRTVENVTYATFREACDAMGLLIDDNEWHEAFRENERTAFPSQLREMFVHIIVNCNVSDVLKLWNEHWPAMSDDVLRIQRRITKIPTLSLSEEDLRNYTLAEIERMLNSIGKSLKHFPTMPYPGNQYLDVNRNRLILEETSYDRKKMTDEHAVLFSKLNHEQSCVYDALIKSVHLKTGGVYFVYGSGGCGKTFLWNTIIARLRSEGMIVLPVASSGIAATLLPGGRTAHSRFKIPLKLDETSMCSISQNSDIAELLKRTDLII